MEDTFISLTVAKNKKMNEAIKVEKIGFIIFILFTISMIINFLFTQFLPHYLSPVQLIKYNSYEHPLALIPIIANSLVKICLSIWIFTKIKNKRQNPWGWVFLTIVFGINAIIIFYLHTIFVTMQSDSEK